MDYYDTSEAKIAVKAHIDRKLSANEGIIVRTQSTYLENNATKAV